MIEIPISYGEFFDKISILQIKQEKITDPDKLLLISVELESLKNLIDPRLSLKVATLHKSLKIINEELWNVEDKLRIMEKKSSFDFSFIKLARSVYVLNDQRFQLKDAINTLLGSKFREVKQYVKYDTGNKKK